MSANRRAASGRLWSSVADTSCATRFHTWWLPSAVRQRLATRLWSAVRVDPVARPSALASLNAVAYSGLVSAGGGPGRNCALLCTAYGVTSDVCTAPAGRKSGGVGCHWPGSLLGGV